MGPSSLPRHADLPVTTGAPAASSWGLWGSADRRGTLNLLDPDRIRRAVGLVELGVVVALNLPLDAIDPPLAGRTPVEREVVVIGPTQSAFDETLLRWNLQSSTQWDGFAHVAEPDIGFYNGLPREDHGVDAWARRGVVGRGVLADLERWWSTAGEEVDPLVRREISAQELAGALAAQHVEVAPGDVLLVRTGWLACYRRLDVMARRALAAGDGGCTGLSASSEVVSMLWDWHVAAVAADNPSLEAWPPAPGDRSLHRSLLVRLGIPIGELFDLEELAARCAAIGRYTTCFVSVPLNLPAGIASPANAVAIL